ncbi:hypothetical protein EYS14_01620 [Alteromonadaceae bacterium M269]|nr:hypothetical protein EYS14_01620 [Alteromonadaceae bacterium M269]
MLGLFKYTEKKLVKDIINVLPQFYDSPIVSYNKNQREITVRNKGDDESGAGIIFLGNIFEKVKNLSKTERVRIIEDFVSTTKLFETLDPEVFMASLALRARTPYDISIRNMLTHRHTKEPFSSTYYEAGGMFLELVFDTEENVSNVTDTKLKEAELSVDEAYKIAAARLHRATDAAQWQQVDDRIWVSSYRDDYDIARIIAAKDENKFPFDDIPVLFFPSHSVCLITNTQDAETVNKLINYGNQLSQDERPLSQELWTIKSDGIYPLDLGANPQIEEIVQLQRYQEESIQYDGQQGILNRNLEDKDDYFVAGYKVYKGDEGLYSQCVYSINLPTLLPKAEKVAIVDPEDLNEDTSIWGLMNWEQFETILGDSMVKMTDLIPDRYELLEPISEKQKEELRKQAVR